ncbi:MAG: competence/damage-inducible protein A [Actinobacteria bacterium]|nr:competence/damage-inducible protein A [Actinomycetota bacterium]
MKAEVIAVGTELLLGEIINSNAQYISTELSRIGIDVMYQTVVGDNEQRIADEISRALDRSDVVIITGGLGPTHDDLTREAITRATGRKLERRPELEQWLRERFAAMGREMADNNLRQADQPETAVAIGNPRGSAPGVDLAHNGKRIFAVPGVPVEMKGMLSDHVIPELSGAAGENTLLSRYLKVAGMGESDVAQRIKHMIDDLDRQHIVTIALLASAGEVRVRITAKARNEKEALELIAPTEERVRGELGVAVYGTDGDTIEGAAAGVLKGRGLKLAIAESVTGGLVVSRMISIPGTSEFLDTGFVTYAIESKIRQLGVDPKIIEEHGAVSKETAIAMAEGARRSAGSDVGLATTGEAGPDPAEAPVGTIFIAVSWEQASAHRKFIAPGDRDAIRRWASAGALNFLRLWAMGEVKPDPQ